jgi:hypothetical protein
MKVARDQMFHCDISKITYVVCQGEYEYLGCVFIWHYVTSHNPADLGDWRLQLQQLPQCRHNVSHLYLPHHLFVLVFRFAPPIFSRICLSLSGQFIVRLSFICLQVQNIVVDAVQEAKAEVHFHGFIAFWHKCQGQCAAAIVNNRAPCGHRITHSTPFLLAMIPAVFHVTTKTAPFPLLDRWLALRWYM